MSCHLHIEIKSIKYNIILNMSLIQKLFEENFTRRYHEWVTRQHDIHMDLSCNRTIINNIHRIKI